MMLQYEGEAKLANFSEILKKLFVKPQAVPPESIRKPDTFNEDDLKTLKTIGLDSLSLYESMYQATQVNFERTVLYRECDRAILHPIVGAAAELYADYVSVYNRIENATVWITSDNMEYKNNLTKFLDFIGIEERIFDWAWTTGAMGDLFVGVEGEPGKGVISVTDDDHPANLSRVDYRGLLVGFYRTPFETGGLEVSNGTADLLAPWDWVHMRCLGAKRKRPAYSDPNFSEYRTIHLMGPETRQVTSKYGTSLLINAIPIYKRLRLAEDSVMLARMTRGIMKYLYMVNVKGMNPDAAREIVDSYMNILKQARSVDTREGSARFDSKSNPLGMVEDLFIPVWGDDLNSVRVEKLGGEVDIKWIVDIEELRNQLATALRCPLSLLGGYIKEATGPLGSEAFENLDIRFARSSRRLQRALIEGITRLCQIHLAYQGMDPDPVLFQVHMSETSTAEEQQIRDALDKSIDAIDKFLNMTKNLGVEFDQLELLNYFNTKILKLGDMDLKKFVKGVVKEAPIPLESRQAVISEAMRMIRAEDVAKQMKRPNVHNLDYLAHLPMLENTSHKSYARGGEWTEQYKNTKINVTKVEKAA